MIRFTFRQLEVFVQIVDCGGINACAELLGISQVSVNEHLSTLERHCGAPLVLRRHGSSGLLTGAGEGVYARAREILHQARALEDALHPEGREGARRKIRIGANEFIAEVIGPKIAGIIWDFPAIDLQQERRSFERVLSGLQERELEIGIFLSFGPVPEIDSTCAWREEVAFYAAKDHPLASGEPVELSDVAQYPFIHLPARTHLRKQFDALLKSIGLGGGPVAMTGESLTLASEILINSTAIVCLFADMPMTFDPKYELQKIKLKCALPKLDVRYAIRAPFHHDPVAKRLASLLSSGREPFARE